MSAATSPRPARYPNTVYLRPPKKGLVQGDIIVGFHHQLRLPGEERKSPGPEDYKSKGIPYFGEHQDRDIKAVLPDGSSTRTLTVRLWNGMFIVLHQNCEITQGDEQDSRIRVAPIVFEEAWPEGPWGEIRQNRLPGYLYLPDLTAEEREATGYTGSWGEAAVVFPSATLSSTGIAFKGKILRLSSHMIPLLQETQVRADSVRGWASIDDKEQWEGRRIIRIDETTEQVMGPVRLAKVFLEDDDGEIEEATVGWGLRPSSKSKS
jgi:hypothetical protein